MKINFNTGEVQIKNETINLTRNELNILKALISKRGVITIEEIYESVYKAKAKELSLHDKRLLYVTINRLKKKLKRSIRIENRYSFGYEVLRNGEI